MSEDTTFGALQVQHASEALSRLRIRIDEAVDETRRHRSRAADFAKEWQAVADSLHPEREAEAIEDFNVLIKAAREIA